MRLPKRPPFLTDGNEIAVEIDDLYFAALFLKRKKTIQAEMAMLKRELDSVNRDLSFLSSKTSTLNEIDAAIAKSKQEANEARKKWQFSEEELHDHYEFIGQA